MTDDRQLAKPVEELARALVRLSGAASTAADPEWQRHVEAYRKLVNDLPNGPWGGLVPTSFAIARTSIDTLRALGMISEFGLEAIKAEEREAGN